MPVDAWSVYQDRLEAHGASMREAAKKREIRLLNSRTARNLSYFTAIINGEEQQVSILSSDNLNEKTIISMPGETIACGAMIEWADNHWIVTEKDAVTELYTKCKMEQCNYLLRWIDKNAEIHEQWCIIDDGTKYMTGDLEDRDFITTRGDARISMTISKNADTVKFGRESRFLIDDYDSEEKLSYSLSKPLRVGWHYNNEGIYVFVLKEANSTDDDNTELGIADYYKYFPKENTKGDDTESDDSSATTNKKGWL